MANNGKQSTTLDRKMPTDLSDQKFKKILGLHYLINSQLNNYLIPPSPMWVQRALRDAPELTWLGRGLLLGNASCA